MPEASTVVHVKRLPLAREVELFLITIAASGCNPVALMGIYGYWKLKVAGRSF
jgi:hypothetical protein